MIRAFVGVRIDPAVAASISEALAQLKPRLAGVRWVARENFHFTLKFLGDVDERDIEPVTSALERSLRLFPRFSINAKGIGVFPELRRARVLWVGLEGKELGDLAAEVERALEPIGFPCEKRPFRPHLTVGRWRSFNSSPRRLAKEIERWQGYEFGGSRVEKAVLFQSLPGPAGAVYKPLQAAFLAP